MAAERLVIDSGFLLESILPTRREWKHDADRLLEAMASGDVQAVVPWVFFYELASVCARKVRARRLDAETVALFFELLTQSGFQLDLALSGPGELYAQAMAMGCQVADSIYLGVAKAQDLPLATVDGGLRTAARSAGVELWTAE
jgi:predicted nucleic acid-binding protein